MISRKRSHTICAKDSGLEIFGGEKEKEEGSGLKTGRIFLRFFKFEKGGKSLRFMLEPFEAYDLWEKIIKVSRQGGKEFLVHKFNAPNQAEIKTYLNVEKWEKGDKSGCAVSIKRGNDSINVSMLEVRFRHLGELLKYFSTTQAWEDVAVSVQDSQYLNREKKVA